MTLSSPPPSLRSAKLDNLTLVPGSLLPTIASWQKLANELPAGSVLLVSSKKSQEQTLITLARSLTKQGKHVRLVNAK